MQIKILNLVKNNNQKEDQIWLDFKQNKKMNQNKKLNKK